MSVTIYKLVFLNDQNFVQERDYVTEAAARTAASAMDLSWCAILKVVSSRNITDVTTP